MGFLFTGEYRKPKYGEWYRDALTGKAHQFTILDDYDKHYRPISLTYPDAVKQWIIVSAIFNPADITPDYRTKYDTLPNKWELFRKIVLPQIKYVKSKIKETRYEFHAGVNLIMRTTRVNATFDLVNFVVCDPFYLKKRV